MQKFEYKILTKDQLMKKGGQYTIFKYEFEEKGLNKMAEEGWELVSVTSENTFNDYYFKRQLK